MSGTAMPVEAAGAAVPATGGLTSAAALAPAVQASVAHLRACAPLLADPAAPAPLAAILGSGWDGVAALVEAPVDVPYAALPAFPALSVSGHAGQVRVGRVGRRPVVLLRGRAHPYETGRADAMNGAVRTLQALGCAAVLLTNAAGSLDAAMAPGSFMLLSDHLNVCQRSPLQDERGADRFVDLAGTYDAALRAQARAIAAAAGVPLHEGIYAWVLGPQFETPAEIRMLQGFGARAVGMSTVPEAIVARHAGLPVLAVSMLTNMGCGLADESLSHAHTLQVAQRAGAAAATLLAALLGRLETR